MDWFTGLFTPSRSFSVPHQSSAERVREVLDASLQQAMEQAFTMPVARVSTRTDAHDDKRLHFRYEVGGRPLWGSLTVQPRSVQVAITLSFAASIVFSVDSVRTALQSELSNLFSIL